MKTILVVARKELREYRRDPRAIVSALLFPLIGPVVFLFLMKTISAMVKDETATVIYIDGIDRAPALVQVFEQAGAIVRPAPENARAQIKEGTIDVVLVVSPHFEQQWQQGQSAQIQVVHDSSRTRAAKSVRVAGAMLERYSNKVARERLVLRGVDPALSAPIAASELDLASSQRSAANLLSVVPLFLLLGAFVGGTHMAIDVTAGERERGSLESLILHPVSARSIVLGKWLATIVVAHISVLLAMFGFALALVRAPLFELGIRAAFDIRSIPITLAILTPLVAMSSALQLLVATFARSFKEAQTYVSLLALVPTIPGISLALYPDSPGWWAQWVPILNQNLLLVGILRGESTSFSALGIAAMISALLAAMLIESTSRLLSSERVLMGR